jgi:hypothetical protein
VRQDRNRIARKRNFGNHNLHRFTTLGLQNLLRRQSPANPYAPLTVKDVRQWKALIKRIEAIEQALTAWEAEHPEAYRSLPWH